MLCEGCSVQRVAIVHAFRPTHSSFLRVFVGEKSELSSTIGHVDCLLIQMFRTRTAKWLDRWISWLQLLVSYYVPPLIGGNIKR